jgi:hypothetical protein
MRTLPVLLLLSLATPAFGASEFYVDFRAQPPDLQAFRMQGRDAELRIKSEARGLRITLPDDVKISHDIVLASTLRIKGDFEITAGYEILSADRPTAGNGVGFLLWLRTDTAANDAVGFHRLTRVEEGDVYLLNRNTTGSDGKRQAKRKIISTTTTSGQLRLQRTGTDVAFWAAEGESADFRELHRFELGADDVIEVRLTAFPGGVPSALDLRLKDFRIRAEDVSGTGGLPQATPRGKLWLVALLCLVGLIVGAGCVWRRRRVVAPQP